MVFWALRWIDIIACERCWTFIRFHFYWFWKNDRNQRAWNVFWNFLWSPLLWIVEFEHQYKNNNLFYNNLTYRFPWLPFDKRKCEEKRLKAFRLNMKWDWAHTKWLCNWLLFRGNRFYTHSHTLAYTTHIYIK